jgi:hypothetical protein
LKPIIDIKNLGFERGAHLLIRRALQGMTIGSELTIENFDDKWPPQLQAWCRSEGHGVRFENKVAIITRGAMSEGRWSDAHATGSSDPRQDNAVLEKAHEGWGLAARGAKVELSSPSFHFRLNQKAEIWAENIHELYTQALAGQWNPDQALDWSTPQEHAEVLEEAIVQIMTYLIENENVALLVPARFLGQVHPHFREVQALMAIQIADEARHADVFTRRIRVYGHGPALSTAGGQTSLKTLLDEPDFSIAQLLLAVLGEGTFVNLLQFLGEVAPDALTRKIAQLTARDESRHVAFGMSHLLYHLEQEPELREKLKAAIHHRHHHLSQSSGLNAEVFDSLLVLAAGSLTPEAVGEGYKKVETLLKEMAEGRKTRLIRLGFSLADAQELANLHTRNFM